MNEKDHRKRVAAERRARMRSRLLSSALRLVAAKGPASTSIDDVISTADVSRGTFYKYFSSRGALVQELAVEIANELVRMTEPVVLSRDDPAERVAQGIRLVSRLAIHHPEVAAFLVRLGWPQVRGPRILLDYVRRDIEEGFRRHRFKQMPIALALNIVAGAVLGATHRMLGSGCEHDFAEQTAAAALRALGVDAQAAETISVASLGAYQIPPTGLLADSLAPSIRDDAPIRARASSGNRRA